MPSFQYPNSHEITPGKKVANPGASSSATLWDSTASDGNNRRGSNRQMLVKRVTCSAYLDVAATFLVEVYIDSIPGGTWRVVNGTGAGEPIAVNTYFERSVARLAPNQRCRIATTTAPGVWEVNYMLHPDAGLSQ